MTPTQLLKEQSNAEEIKTELNSQIINYDKIENTPFTMVTQDETYFLTMGQYRLSEQFKTKQALTKWMNQNSWNLMLSISMIVHESMKDFKEYQNTNAKND